MEKVVSGSEGAVWGSEASMQVNTVGTLYGHRPDLILPR